MNQKSFYITTTLPYVNAEPHLGHAMEFIRADIIARWKKLNGLDVFFNTGTDEHGQKIFQKAKEEGKDINKFVDEKSKKFKDLIDILNIDRDIHFIRTTDPKHIKTAQKFWKRCDENGFIYKKNYKIKYCVGCELEKTDSELVDGKCSIHPNLEIELIDEENYFFKFSAFGEKLLKFYAENSSFVIPESRFNEIKSFVSMGLEDFSISRLKEKMSWGVPVSGDSNQVMYVWFDALVSYISTLGWPDDAENFQKYWVNGTPTQYCGKDNLRQQSAMWQAMLMAVGLPNSNQIVIDGFIQSGNQKMSKSLGNVMSPMDLVNEYGTDALRYYVSRELSTFEDSDFTVEKFKEAYNANLANGLGNLVARIMKLAEIHLNGPVEIKEQTIHDELREALDKFEIQKATNHIWNEIGKLDVEIQEKKPWESKDKEIITSLVFKLSHVARTLAPFMPETSEKILTAIKNNKLETNLFPRKE
jgi:methionyl-tRNA synthetase